MICHFCLVFFKPIWLVFAWQPQPLFLPFDGMITKALCAILSCIIKVTTLTAASICGGSSWTISIGQSPLNFSITSWHIFLVFKIVVTNVLISIRLMTLLYSYLYALPYFSCPLFLRISCISISVGCLFQLNPYCN